MRDYSMGGKPGRSFYLPAPCPRTSARPVLAHGKLVRDRQNLKAGLEQRAGALICGGGPGRVWTSTIIMVLMVSNGYRKTYTVTPDGQRFLVNVLIREQNTQAMSVMLDWPARVRALMGAGQK